MTIEHFSVRSVLGAPPDRLSHRERMAWEAILREIPDDVDLQVLYKFAVEEAAMLLGRDWHRKGEDKWAALDQWLQELEIPAEGRARLLADGPDNPRSQPGP